MDFPDEDGHKISAPDPLGGFRFGSEDVRSDPRVDAFKAEVLWRRQVGLSAHFAPEISALLISDLQPIGPTSGLLLEPPHQEFGLAVRGARDISSRIVGKARRNIHVKQPDQGTQGQLAVEQRISRERDTIAVKRNSMASPYSSTTMPPRGRRT